VLRHQVCRRLYRQDKGTLRRLQLLFQDVINIFYTESRYSFPGTEKLGALFAIQFTDQCSTGSDLLQGRFSTNQVGIKGEVSYSGAVLAVGYTHANRGADLRNPLGSQS
jgi:hypothetical protein